MLDDKISKKYEKSDILRQLNYDKQKVAFFIQRLHFLNIYLQNRFSNQRFKKIVMFGYYKI